MREKRITEGDLVSVNFNGAQNTLYHRAFVKHIPCATGDSWIFEEDVTGNIAYVSEGCTVELIRTT